MTPLRPRLNFEQLRFSDTLCPSLNFGRQHSRILLLSLEFGFSPFSGNGVFARSLVLGLLNHGGDDDEDDDEDDVRVRVVCERPHLSTPGISDDWQVSRMETMGAAGHGLYCHLWADRARSNRRRALIGSWVTPPMTVAIKIEQGGDKNITINHGCGGGNCGGSCNSDGNSDGDGGGGGGRGDDSDERRRPRRRWIRRR
jgi:hypothetical protein